MSELNSNKSLIAERLREAREQVGLSQGQAAKLMKMHRPSISEIEAGRRRVVADEITQFARHYHVRVSWLLGDDEESLTSEFAIAARQIEKLKPADKRKVLRFLQSVEKGGNAE